MKYKDCLDLLKEYENIPKCIYCEAYHGAMARLSKDSPSYSDNPFNKEIYGFLNCDFCPPLELIEEYLKTEGRRKLLKIKKKKNFLEEFSVKLFLRKISGEL